MVNHHPTRNCNFAGMLPPFFGDPQFSNALKWGQFFWNENSPNNAKMATPAELAESSGPVVDFVVESINQLVTTARLLNFHASISKTSPILFFLGYFATKSKPEFWGLPALPFLVSPGDLTPESVELLHVISEPLKVELAYVTGRFEKPVGPTLVEKPVVYINLIHISSYIL